MLFKEKMLMLSVYLIMVICVLIGVAFLTLMERKLLGYIQLRKGPNKVGYMGIFQPFGDAIKLFSKEQMMPSMSNMNLYYFSPVFSMIFSLMLWICIPFLTILLNFNLSFIFFFCLSSLGVYMIMISGWASNSNYSMLGSMRAIAQIISYEVSFILIVMSFLFLTLSVNILDLMKYQENIWFMLLMVPLGMIWLVSLLAETNRSPFDLAEGESELVSGFNIEYSSGLFALIFLAEYTSILFMSFLCSVMLMGGDLNNFNFYVKVVFFSFFWVWVRGTLPRFRYDKLMNLAWKSYLTISLNLLIFIFGLKFLVLFM